MSRGAPLPRVLPALLLGGALLLAVWGRADADPADPKPEASRGWTYTLRFAPGLQRVHVRVCFQGYVPKRLRLTRPEALSALRMLPLSDGAASFRPNPSRDGVLPRGLKEDGCLSYEVDLARLTSIFRKTKEAVHVGRDFVARTGLLFLHPAVWPRDARVTVLLEVPPGYRAAVPWKQSGDRYVLDEGAMLLSSRMAIGRWEPQSVAVPAGTLQVALLDAPHHATRAGIERWLGAAGRTVADLYGGFPVPEAAMIVQPLVPGRGRPVVFGRASLAGGAHMHVMLSGTTSDSEMPGEWLTIHEMLHLGMPWTRIEERWFQEGFVTYYQTVLRARAGFLTEQQAWQRLHDQFERGRGSGGRRSLADESRLMTNGYAYHRVYMGGAALALLMDVEIRRRWPGQRSLDDVMRHLHKTHVVANRTFTGLALMGAADRLLGTPICEPIAKRHLSSSRFPSVRSAFAALGLRVEGGRVTYTEGAPQQGDRSAIMRPGGR